MSTTLAFRPTARSLMTVALFAAALIAPATASAQSQQARSRSSRVTASMPAVAVVRHVTAPKVHARRDGRVELVTAVTVAANTKYRVVVRTPAALPAGLRVLVRDANGVYVRLGGAPVQVARGERGTTLREVAYRVEGDGEALRAAAPRLSFSVERTTE